MPKQEKSDRGIGRRKFLKAGAGAAAGAALAAAAAREARAGAAEKPAARVGLIGCGGRGRSLLETMLGLGPIEVPALCDVNPDALKAASEIVVKSGRKAPEGYSGGPEDYRRLVAREDIDAVFIATPWNWHAPMAARAMEAGKYVAVEVPAAITVEECWNLVETSERTGKPCMMLENWSFRRDNLAVLNMIRRGLLGEIVHCHCAHSHNCVDHWYFDGKGSIRWGGEFLVRRNADQYPTHSLGPVLSWLDINAGDSFASLTSTATRSLGINDHFRRKFGPDHPNAKRTYAQGDIVTTVVKTRRGNTVVVNNDMQLPRPYDNRWMVQGTRGIYDEARASVFVLDRSPKYEEWEPFGPYQEEFDHSWWKELRASGGGGGHEGTDLLELAKFLDAVRAKGPAPIDVYDSVTMSAVIPLSEKSIAQGSGPVEFPDFTKGRWKTAKPTFASER
jgi:predicted dehydrogenase